MVLAPTVNFSVNGDSIKKIINSTIATISGDYTSAQYVISTSNTIGGITESWNSYTSGNIITLSNLTGDKYVWIKVLGQDGNYYTFNTAKFVMVLEPTVNFSVNGDSTLKTLNSTIATISGDYTSAQYVISTSSTIGGVTESWNSYTSGNTITLSNLTGDKYVWIKVLGQDGNYYTFNTAKFAMVLKPTVTFSKDGDSIVNKTNSTIATIGGDYTSAQYVISTSSTIGGVTESWNSYTSGNTITLSNLTGDKYVWIKVLGQDGNYYTFNTAKFAMVSDWNQSPIEAFVINPADNNEPLLEQNTRWISGQGLVTVYDCTFSIFLRNVVDVTKIEYSLTFNGITNPYTELTDTAVNGYIAFSKLSILLSDIDNVGGEATAHISFRLTHSDGQITVIAPQTYTFVL
jgi:putative NADPH-quinone reductase